MATRARSSSSSSAAASSTRATPDEHSALMASLRATAGLRVTKSRLARATAAALPPPAPVSPVVSLDGSPVLSHVVSPVVSPVASPAASLAPSPAASVCSVASSVNRLRELRFDVLMGISDSGDDDAVDPNATTVARPLSPTESTSGLFDDGDDDEASGGSAAKRRRLRRGDTVPLKHPALPAAPEVHPYTKHRNYYDPEAPWDYDKKVNIKRLLDCHGNPPHRCYLVQWQGRPLQLSWVWREELVDVVPDSVNRIDAWKASGSKEPIMSYFDNRDTASDDDCCFIDAIRAALYHLGCPDLVTVEMWEVFEKTRPSDIQYGVTREDVTEFFKYLQRKSV
ncbi:hypothetical protein PHPALM_6803, partial [Phytophthora palmivora]